MSRRRIGGTVRINDTHVVPQLLSLVLVTCLTGSEARAQTSKVIQDLADRVKAGAHTSGDQSATKQGANAACSLSNALVSLAAGDAKGFEAQIDQTISAIDGATRTVADELEHSRTLGRRVDVARFKEAIDIDLDGVGTRRDLLQKILALMKAQSATLQKLKKEGKEEDLGQAIRLSGQMSRTLTVYLTS